MKKLLLVLLLVLVSVSCFATELSADSVAVQPSVMEQIITQAVNASIAFAASIAMLILSGIYDAVRKYLATTRYGQETGIILESVRTAVLRKAKERNIEYSALLKEIGLMAVDFKLDAGEKLRLQELRSDITSMAREIAAEQLKQVRGLAKDAAGKWVAERIDLMLGELVSQVLGLPVA